MKGVSYNYANPLPEKLHRWFISYEDRRGRYIEENFDLRREAKERIKVLSKRGIECELWTRERALPEDRLK